MILYEQIHRYHAEHKSARWIAGRLKINPRTVKKYLSMSQAEFERHSDNINRKGFKPCQYAKTTGGHAYGENRIQGCQVL